MSNEVYELENPAVSVVEQNIEVNALGGNSFVPEDRVEIHIPANTGFINPAESYLQFEVEMGGVGMTIPNGLCGGHGFIDQLYVRSLHSGETLESIDNYNVLAQTILWRSRSKNDHRNLQDLALICEDMDLQNSAYDIAGVQPYWIPNSTTGTKSVQKVRMNLNLLSGVLGGLGRNNLVPVNALGGLNITMNLAPALQSCFPITSSVQTTATTPTRTLGDLVNQFEVLADNFTCGSTGQQKVYSFTSFTNTTAKAEQSLFPLQVGQSVRVDWKKGGVAQAQHTGDTIASIDEDGAKATRITLTTGIAMTNGDVVSDVSFDGLVEDATYTLSNIKMVLQVVAPTPQQLKSFNSAVSSKEGKNWRYYSATNYRTTIGSTQLQASIRIPTINTKCLSLLSVPQHLNLLNNNGDYGFTKDGSDGEKEYQYLIKTKLVPDRKVGCVREDAELKNGKYKIWQREIEKCLRVGGVDIHRLDGDNSKSGTLKTPFVIGRAVGTLKSTSMLANTEPTLNVNYSTKNVNQLYHNFVFHTRNANFSQRGLVVSY